MHIIGGFFGFLNGYFLDHYLGSGSLFNHEHFYQLLFINLINQLFYFVVCQHVLHVSASDKMSEPIAVVLTFLAQLFVDLTDVVLF